MRYRHTCDRCHKGVALALLTEVRPAVFVCQPCIDHDDAARDRWAAQTSTSPLDEDTRRHVATGEGKCGMSEFAFHATTRKTETTFALTGAPDIKVPYTTMTIRPDEAIVTDVDGVVVSVRVTGARVLKSGAVSENTRSDRDYRPGRRDGTWAVAEEFVRVLVTEVAR